MNPSTTLIKQAIVILIIMGLSCGLYAADNVATHNGNWGSASTWSLSRSPQDGDVIFIPAGVTVMFSAAPYPKNNPAARPTLHLKIYGTLDFSDPGNDKLYLDVGSTITLFAGGRILTTNSNPEIIAIYNGTYDNTVWSGDPNVVHGPSLATATTLGFANSVLYAENSSVRSPAAQFVTDRPWCVTVGVSSIRFTSPRRDALHYFIYSTDGKLLKNGPLASDNRISAPDQMPRGIYILLLSGKAGFSEVEKFRVN